MRRLWLACASWLEHAGVVGDLAMLSTVAALVILPALGQTQYLAHREIRHAEIIREMAESRDYLVPHRLGKVYRDKPPVMHSLAAKFMQWGGGPSLFFARLPSALAGIAAVLAAYGLGRVMQNRRVALVTGFVLLAIPGFAIMARQARPDMILCFAITTCSLALALGMRSQQRGTRTAWFAAAGAMAGLGVVTKGPYGLLFPLIFVVLGPLRRPEWRRPRAGWLIFGAALLLAASVWAVPAYLRDGGKFLHEVVFQPDLDITERPSAWYDLIAPAIFLSLPVGLFVPMAVADWRKYGFPAALACAAAILLVVQAVPKKRQHYLLPMYPFLAVGLAASISRHASESKRIRRAASAAVLMGMAVTPFYFGVAMKWTEYAEDANLQTARHILDLLQPHKPVYVLNNLAEPMAWVGLDHRRLVELDIQDPENAAQLHDAPPGSYLVVNADRRERLQSIAGPLRFSTVAVIEWPQSRLDELLEFPNRPPRKVMVLRLANCSTNIPAS